MGRTPGRKSKPKRGRKKPRETVAGLRRQLATAWQVANDYKAAWQQLHTALDGIRAPGGVTVQDRICGLANERNLARADLADVTKQRDEARKAQAAAEAKLKADVVADLVFDSALNAISIRDVRWDDGKLRITIASPTSWDAEVRVEQAKNHGLQTKLAAAEAKLRQIADLTAAHRTPEPTALPVDYPWSWVTPRVVGTGDVPRFWNEPSSICGGGVATYEVGKGAQTTSGSSENGS